MSLWDLITKVQRDTEELKNTVRIMFISNVFLDPYMELYLRKHFAEIKLKVDYNYENLETIENASSEIFERADLVIVIINYDCITNQQKLSSYWDKAAFQKLNDYISNMIIQIESKVTKGNIFMFELEDFFLPQKQFIGNVSVSDNVVDEVNFCLRKFAHKKNIVLLDTKNILAEIGLDQAYVYKNQIRWDCVYSQLAVEKFAYEICKQYKVDRKISKKCVVLDCDNVLWGGILSEIGINDIQLGNQGVGLSYKKFQSFIVDLYNLGIVLVLCSKNDISDIKAVFREHKEMILKEEYISYYAVSWDNKTKGIIEASQYLNLSLDSMVFVDDNIAEIKEVQSILPEVECILFDVWNPFQGFRDLFNLSYQVEENILECRRTTYKTNILREKEKRNQEDYEQYLKTLDTKISIQCAQRNELKRISELLLRTNKCSNGKRYSMKELENIFCDNNYEIYAVYAKDCFSDLGLVGGMVVYEKKYLDAFCLSCRVLGRGLEQMMIEYIVLHNEILSYNFILTGKNDQLKKLLKNKIC